MRGRRPNRRPHLSSATEDEIPTTLKGYVPDPVKSAERNLRERIEAFPGKDPLELEQVSKAREMLARRLFTIGEQCMFRAQTLYKERTGIEL